MAGFKGILSKTFGVAGATVASRILGLVRVRLESELLGGKEIASAWFLAFSIPNLLRRLLGEGALANALIPLFAETEKQHGLDRARQEFGVIFAALLGILSLLVILFSAAAWVVSELIPHTPGNFRYYFAARLVVFLMPYACFMCLVGIASAVLNYAKVFILPALGALLLNIFLIGGMMWGVHTHVSASQESMIVFMHQLTGLVLLSGAIQLALMLVLLKIYGRFPDFSHLRDNSAVLKKLFCSALPGLIGGAAVQISFLVDRTLGLYINNQAVPALTYTDRLIDIPIGIFAVAMGQVMMARMSKSAASGNISEMTGELNYSLRHLIFWSVPMAAGIIVFHDLFLGAICLGGNYKADDLEAARGVAVFYGCGIPFFCAAKLLLPAFYARKSFYKPLYCSLAAIGVNLVCSVALMFPLQQAGIALATVISSLVNNTLLVILLGKEGVKLELHQQKESLLFAVLFSAVGCTILRWGYSLAPAPSGRIMMFVYLALIAAGFGIFYIAAGLLCKVPEVKEMADSFRHRK